MRRSLILHNAKVITMCPAGGEVTAVAIEGDRIVAVGSEANILPLARQASESIDCRGRALLPGFIDAHAHVLAQAAALANLDCGPTVAPTIGALVSRIRERASVTPRQSWIRARGYHEASLPEHRHPTRWELDQAAGRKPVRLVHASGHASVLNSAGLAFVGIGIDSEEPPGGQIDRDDQTGEPTGLLIEMEDWLERVIPPDTSQDMEKSVAALSQRFLATGVTSVQDLGHRNGKRKADFFAQLVADGRFKPRLTLATGYEAFVAGERAVADGIGPGPVKIMLNETEATPIPDSDDLNRMVQAVHTAGMQVAIHAVEPSSIQAALAAIHGAQCCEPRAEARHRIEHAAITPPALEKRIAELGVTVVSNPAFLWEHGDRYIATLLDAELPALYDTAGLLKAGVRVAAGSDCPVAAPDPALGIAAAVLRQTRTGKRIPGELLEFSRALGLFTSGAAWAGGYEKERGRIAPGMLADLVLCEVSGFTINGALTPVMTILGGEVAWHTDAVAA